MPKYFSFEDHTETSWRFHWPKANTLSNVPRSNLKSFCFSPSMYILLLFTEAYFSFPCSLLLCICFRNTSAGFHNHHVYIRPSLPLFSSSTKFPDYPISAPLAFSFSQGHTFTSAVMHLNCSTQDGCIVSCRC